MIIVQMLTFNSFHMHNKISTWRSLHKAYLFRHLVYVTGSAKTGHNRTSLNLQYKALKTLGAYWRIIEKFHKIFERFFLCEQMA